MIPVWPFLMLIVAGLTLWGWRHDAWVVPLIALAGYVAMRLVVMFAPYGYVEVIGCASWLFFAAIMLIKGGAIPAFFFAFSAMTYPAFLMFGVRIEYMGLSPIIAESFAALALLSIGGGIYGYSHSALYSSGFMDRLSDHSVGVALRSVSAKADSGRW